ncbi:hypothetical protein CF326_g3207 [Tilletia indica]|nr:hypothetical protein CF326_g3207 [Tilletia indica]
MLDLNIPWPTQTFADAQRAGVALRQQQQQTAGGSGSGGGDAQTLDGSDQAPLSKKAKKKLQKQQQQQQQNNAVPPPSDPPSASTSTIAPVPLPEWSPLGDLPTHDQLRLRLLTTSLASLGYKTCAFNHTLAQPVRFDPLRHGNPFSTHSAAASAIGLGGGKGKGGNAGAAPRGGGDGKRAIAPVPFPELDPRFRGSSSGGGSKDGKGKQKANVTSTIHLDPSLLDPGSTPIQSLRIVQLHRLTLPLDDSSCSSAPGQGHGLVASAGPALQSYDLLAVSPTTESSFSLACLSLAELRPFGIDIISLDLGSQPRLPFWVKRSLVGAAIQLGVVFEIAYSGALASSSSSSSGPSADSVRRNLISSTRSLLLLTKGTNVIISSGARDAMQLRAPLDVINLFGAILGMGESAARLAIGSGAEAVVRRARARKEVWRGIVGEVRLRTGGSTSGKDPDGSLGIEATSTPSGPTAGTSHQHHTGADGTSSIDARKKKRKRDTVEAG